MNHPNTTSPLLSFCMIVKDEANNLPRCLESVRPHVDEMIVVDTGSQDQTIAIAEQYGATIQHFTWCDDFAAARNFALDQVHGQWILTLDADEELIVAAADWREQLISEENTWGFWIRLLDAAAGMTDLPLPRLFRNHPDLRYANRYHETLQYRNQLLPADRFRPVKGIQIIHYGYSDQQVLTKNLNRDIPLLERLRQQGELSLVLLMTLADDYLRTNQLDKAQSCWAEAFDRISPNLFSGTLPADPTRLRALLFTLGSDFLLHRGDYETAMLICRQGTAWFPDYPPLLHLSGLLLKALGFPWGAIGYFQQCLQMGWDKTYQAQEPFDIAFVTLWPAIDLGQTYLELHQDAAAIDAFELALSFDPNSEPARAGLVQAQQALR